MHQDVAEFHFDDCQRLLHISGCQLRYLSSLQYFSDVDTFILCMCHNVCAYFFLTAVID